MKTNLPKEISNQILQRDNFSCVKCGFQDLSTNELEICQIPPTKNSPENFVTLCSICSSHAPQGEKEFKKYISEKIDKKILETFRKSNYSKSQKTKIGMSRYFEKGNHISKPPFGYKLINKQLFVNENAEKVKEIFEEFVNSEVSLTQLAKKNGFTTPGIKKLLQNTTYIGKVKFENKEIPGNHQPIVDKQLFKQAQEKLGNVRN